MSVVKSVILFAISAYLTSYLLDNNYISFANIKPSKRPLFTKEELKKYNGIDRPELYLAILGHVFDVSEGVKYYGPGETYHSFIGKDNSRSFISGEFEEEKSSDDVIGFTNQELRQLDHWLKFYKKQYKKIGKLIGRFYDDRGKLTPYGKEIKLLIKSAEEANAEEDKRKLEFPPCNIEWDEQNGSRVWCTSRSGGIERGWVGVPRQLYEAGADNYRCTCIHDGNKHLGNIKEYEGCDPESPSCFVQLNP